MKYVVILGDGMADEPCMRLGGKTPLQVAKKPNMDYLSKYGIYGLVKTVPQGMSPGSDVANLSVMGYDTAKYYTGRSPLEAVSMGIQLEDTDITYRCNLVTLSDEPDYEDKTMLDYSAGEITTEEAAQLIKAVAEQLNTPTWCFYPGISYRHCLVWHEGSTHIKMIPPHDISLKKVTGYLPVGDHADVLLDLMKKSVDILKDHPVNKSRLKRGLNPATSIWLWGEGKKPILPNFYDKYHLKGAVISAVDLVKGIGLASGMASIDVEGATGNIHTNFKGKAQAAIDQLASGMDFLYVHIEAPDECGHQNQLEDKIKAIELIDRDVLGPILEALDHYNDYRILLLPDHPTPLIRMTHTSDPVPFVIYTKSKKAANGTEGYDEFQAEKSGLFIQEGYTLMDKFLKDL